MKMLYVTTQRVRATKEGEQGINTFIYETSSLSLPSSASVLIDLAEAPGKLISEQRMMRQGGNLVISYLDVVCRDDLPVTDLESDLKAFSTMSSFPFFIQNGRVAIGYSHSGHVSDPVSEFSILAEKVTEIFRDRPPLPATPLPFKIIGKKRLIDGEQHLEFRLDEESGRRLKSSVQVPCLIVKEETVRSFQEQNGNFPIEMAVMLTGIPQAQLHREGGFIVFDDKGKLIMRWDSLCR